MIMRTYALYGQSRKVLIALVTIGLITLALGMVSFIIYFLPWEWISNDVLVGNFKQKYSGRSVLHPWFRVFSFDDS